MLRADQVVEASAVPRTARFALSANGKMLVR